MSLLLVAAYHDKHADRLGQGDDVAVSAVVYVVSGVVIEIPSWRNSVSVGSGGSLQFGR